MKAYLIEIIFALIASVICILYIIFPTAHLMAIFVFVAQPMFAYAVISTCITIVKDLRRKEVL